MTDFEAETKRSWFSVRDSLRGARSRGVLWLQANVSLKDSQLRVSTSEGIREFRPHRLVWQAPSQFLVSGLTHGRLFRTVLRFKTEAEAQRAASAILEVESVGEELTPLPGEEVSAEINIAFGRLFSLWLLFWLVVLTLLLIPTFLKTFDLNVLGSWILLVLAFLAPRLILRRLAGKTNSVWVRREGNTLYLRSLGGKMPLVPSKVEWKDHRTFVVRTGRRRMELVFPTAEKALEALRLIQTCLPGIEVFHRESQQFSPTRPD